MNKCPVCNKEFQTETNHKGYVRPPFDQAKFHLNYHRLEEMAQRQSAKQSTTR